MTDSGNCPSQQVNGTLSAAEADSLEQHLLECEPCSQSAETLFPVNEITAIFNRKEPPTRSSEDEEAISRLITQAKELKPSAGRTSDQPTKTLVENEDTVNDQTLIDSGNYTALWRR